MTTRNFQKTRIKGKARRDRVKGKDGAGFTRTLLDLKLEHIIVMQALEDANRSHERAVGVAEIAEKISPLDKKKLEKTYVNKMTHSISKILPLLITRGLVFSPGAFNKRRFYGSVQVLDPNSTELPNIRSRRFRVLELVRETVHALRRPVRASDVLNQAKSSGLHSELKEFDITHDILSLAEKGEVIIVGRVRGENKGLNLYLPSEIDPSPYLPVRPLTWLDEVAQTVEKLWTDRIEEAAAGGGLPRPFTTGDVRARLLDSPFHTQRQIKQDPQIIVDAVKNLSSSNNPLLRCIRRRGQKALLWVPADVTDDKIDFGSFYANDAERMGAAVERAVKRHGRPVTVRDIKDEVDADLTLHPVTTSSLFQTLKYASRETFDSQDGKGPQKRQVQRVADVGRVGGNTYYSVADTAEARGFVDLRRLELRWSTAQFQTQLETLGAASIPSVAKGRAMMLKHDLAITLGEVSELLMRPDLDSTTGHEAQRIQEQTKELANSTDQWLAASESDHTDPPSNPLTAATLWSGEEFLDVARPLHPAFQTISVHQFLRLMTRQVRRIPNPKFEYRFSDNFDLAAEFFFDPTDALIYAAKRWGGRECSLQAMLASRELGYLRDPAFVLPGLKARSFEVRLAAVACLAFLWSDEGTSRLKDAALQDREPGVRQSALWAYGFAGGAEARSLFEKAVRDDPNHRVQQFASQALTMDSWWQA
jgi:hypothetical protein